MGASCTLSTYPTNCQLMPGGPWGWAASGRAWLETSVILSGTQEAELEGHGTSLQEGWTNGQLVGNDTARGTQVAPRPRGTIHGCED